MRAPSGMRVCLNQLFILPSNACNGDGATWFVIMDASLVRWSDVCLGLGAALVTLAWTVHMVLSSRPDARMAFLMDLLTRNLARDDEEEQALSPGDLGLDPGSEFLNSVIRR